MRRKGGGSGTNYCKHNTYSEGYSALKEVGEGGEGREGNKQHEQKNSQHQQEGGRGGVTSNAAKSPLLCNRGCDRIGRGDGLIN